jgi:hypothetical protein
VRRPQREIRGATLVAHAMSEMRQGVARSALEVAKEAIEIFEAETEAGNDCSEQLASTCVLASTAALAVRDMEQADELGRRALELLEREGIEGPLLIEALAARALTEFHLVATSSTRRDKRPTAGPRLFELYGRMGATGTIADSLLAEGLRLYALTVMVPGVGQPTDPPPAQLLDAAIGLVTDAADSATDAALALGSALLARARILDSQDDLQEAQRVLRRSAASNAVAAQHLALAISWEVSRAAAETDDVSGLIERLQEAVGLLDAAVSAEGRETRCAVLMQTVRAPAVRQAARGGGRHAGVRGERTPRARCRVCRVRDSRGVRPRGARRPPRYDEAAGGARVRDRGD